MEPLPVDVLQLQRRDPLAWTVLLSRSPELADVIVTAVTAEPLWDMSLVTPGRATVERVHHVRRYVLTLAGCSDPITFIAKQTNAIEALNSKLRRAVRARGHFPSDDAATKLLYLILNRSEKEWKMPPREWSMAKAQFAVIFGERFIKAMAP